MKIKKKLKNAEFQYHEETKKFLIVDGQDGSSIELNKVYAFAFMRFVVRMAQRNWFRQKKLTSNNDEDLLSSANQLEMF